MSTFDDLMGNSQSGKKPSFYTADDIDKARKRMNKFGGTLLENLRIVTGRDASYNMDLQKEISNLNENLLKDFGVLDLWMKKMPLPKERSEFEDRARLFAVMRGLEEFLQIKKEYMDQSRKV